MAARRYEIYLRALTNVSRVSEADERILFNKRWNFVSPSGHIISSIYHINTNKILNKRRCVKGAISV